MRTPVAGMRRVIRHIFTIVTFERWSINWEEASEDGTVRQDSDPERFWIQENRDSSGHGQQEVEMPEEDADGPVRSQ